MLTYADMLNALFANCACPIPVRVDGVSTFTDNPDLEDTHENSYEVCANTVDGVAFVVGKIKGADRRDAEMCRLKPSVAIYKRGIMMVMWSFDTLVSREDARHLVADAGMESVDTFVHLPPSDEWELVHADMDCYYSLEQLRGAYCRLPDSAFDAAPHYRDARVLTPYDPNDYNKVIVVSSAGRKEAQSWDPQSCSISAFIRLLAEHREGGKNGPGFVLADLASGRRTKNAVKAIYGVGLDIDTGTRSNFIDRALEKSGWLALRYTTHSHGKTSSEFVKERITQFAKGEDLSTALTQRFLLETEGWDPSIAESVELDEEVHAAAGIMVRVRHAPMPKNRVILFLQEPYVIANEAPSQAEATRNWAKIPTAIAKKLGVPLDKACLDPCRLFFYPRHDKGSPFEISLFGGRLIARDELDLNDDPSGPGKGPGKGGKSSTAEGKALGRWCAERGDGFQIVDALHAFAPDRIRGQATPGVTIECPFDELHSNAGDPDDTACFAVNAGEGSAPVFVISCRHESCRDKTNLDMLGKILKDEWFEKGVLSDGTFDGLLREEEAAPARCKPAGGVYESKSKLIADLKPQAAVLLGANQTRLIVEKGDSFELLSKSDASTWFQKYQLKVNGPPVHYIPGLKVYLDSPDRLEFEGITTDPTAPRREGRLYTTWRGFARKPSKGDWALMRQHLKEIVCAGDSTSYVWLMSWMAQMLQQPAKKLGTAVVLRGTRGCGKTTVGFALRKIIGKLHSRKVSQESHVTGKFNDHLRDCLFLLVEEGVWGGNKSAEGVLKDLITGDTLMIEPKFVGATETPNFTRVMITSNEKWVVPAGKSERRFLVLDAVDLFDGLPDDSPERAAYFDPLYDELEHGGYEAMLADLLAWDHSKVDLRKPPVTDGLRRQMAQTFTDEEQWILGALLQHGFTNRAGERVGNSNEWELDRPLEISTASLLESFRAHVGSYRGSAPSHQRMLQVLSEHGQIVKKRLTFRGDRSWGYVLSPLRDWRARFTENHKYGFEDESAVVDLQAFRAGRAEERSEADGK